MSDEGPLFCVTGARQWSQSAYLSLVLARHQGKKAVSKTSRGSDILHNSRTARLHTYIVGRHYEELTTTGSWLESALDAKPKTREEQKHVGEHFLGIHFDANPCLSDSGAITRRIRTRYRSLRARPPRPVVWRHVALP